MNKIFISIALLLSLGCAQNNKFSNNITKVETLNKSEVLNITDELYNLEIKIETTENHTYNLVISVELKKGSYYVSPNAKGDYSGKFNVDLGSYENVQFDGNIKETPLSVEVIDKSSYDNDHKDWVRINTIYKQQLNINSTADYEVFGRVRFTIEPRCSYEEIPFKITYKSGKIIVSEAKC